MGRSVHVGAQTLTGLVCPACRGSLDDLACAGCGAQYAKDDGIAVLLAEDVQHVKARQADWFDRLDAEYEIERPAGTPAFHAWLLAEKFRRGTGAIAELLPGSTALAICGGSGLDAEHLARAGASAITVDVSIGAAKRALERGRRHGVELTSIVADAEALPFADRGVDVVYVHDGLHHVDRPLLALAEMARVARKAVSVNEPARAAVTGAAVRAGLALEHEDAGNTVYRFSVDEVVETLEDAGFRILVAERYAMLYRHEAGPVTQLLSRPRLQPLAAGSVRTLDLLGGRLGNKLTVQAVRE
jgi:SAM-dependent methyltransferase